MNQVKAKGLSTVMEMEHVMYKTLPEGVHERLQCLARKETQMITQKNSWARWSLEVLTILEGLSRLLTINRENTWIGCKMETTTTRLSVPTKCTYKMHFANAGKSIEASSFFSKMNHYWVVVSVRGCIVYVMFKLVGVKKPSSLNDSFLSFFE